MMAPWVGLWLAPRLHVHVGRQKGLDGRVVHLGKLLHGANGLHLAVGQHRHTVGHLPEQIQVMGDHHNTQAGLLAQFQHQGINTCGALRIQPGSGFVQKQQLRLQHQRPGQRGTFQHAAAELRGVLAGHGRIQPDLGQLLGGKRIHLGVAQVAMFAQGQTNVFQHRQRTKQPALLKQHAKTLPQCQGSVIGDVGQIHAQHLDTARIRDLQQNHLAQQGGFARATAANHRKNLGPAYFQLNPIVHHVGAKTGLHLVHLQHGMRGVGWVGHVTNPAH